LFAQSPAAAPSAEKGEPVILRYDPYQHIASEAWQALDESERIESVQQYHRRNRIRLPNERLHAIIHVIVENQVALGDTFLARAVLLRLMEEGLDRHEAVHAIGSVLSEQLFAALREKAGADLNAQYVEKLNRLTAESWRKQAP
jgi:uncharacterized protein DUF1841